MKRVAQKTPIFLLTYALLMSATYVLPYFGSNSILALGLTGGLTIFWTVVHVSILIALMVISYQRGQYLNKSWLWCLPLVAALFDIIPVLSSIPFVPTLFHILTLAIVITNQNLIIPEEKSVASSFKRRNAGSSVGTM